MTAAQIKRAVLTLTDLRRLSQFFAAILVAMLLFLATYTWLLASDWCSAPAALAAATGEQLQNNVTAECFRLLHEQIHALSFIAYGLTATVGLSVLVFAIVVWAGAKVSGKGGADGVALDVS